MYILQSMFLLINLKLRSKFEVGISKIELSIRFCSDCSTSILQIHIFVYIYIIYIIYIILYYIYLYNIYKTHTTVQAYYTSMLKAHPLKTNEDLL